METKEIIELMVPENCFDEYVARINVSKGYFARIFQYSDSKTYDDVSAIVIEDVEYDKILKFIEELSTLPEIIVIDNSNERYHQYLYTAQLKRHGVHFITRAKFLERFDDDEELTEDPKSKKFAKVEKKESKFNIFNRISKEKNAVEKAKKNISTLLTTSKPTVQKVELRTAEKEKMIPVIKIQEKEAKKTVKGTYILYGGAFTTFLLTEYLASKAVITVVDFTGILNHFYGCSEDGKVRDLISGKDDPLIMHGKIIYYADSDVHMTIEELLSVREILQQETSIVVFYMPSQKVSAALPVADKVFFCVDEGQIITGEWGAGVIESSSKAKVIISQRMNILTRHAVKEQLNIEDATELLEVPFIETGEMKSIYKSIDKQEMVSKSVLEKYFKKFSEQL